MCSVVFVFVWLRVVACLFDWLVLRVLVCVVRLVFVCLIGWLCVVCLWVWLVGYRFACVC